MSIPQAYPEPGEFAPSDYPAPKVQPEPQNGNGFRSGPFPGMYPAPTVEESIRLSLLVAAGRIPWPTRYVDCEVQP